MKAFLLLCVVIFSFISIYSDCATATDIFDKEFNNAKTSQALEELLKKHPDQVDLIVPKLETTIIKEIETQGVKKRYVIKKIVPLPNYASGGITFKESGQKGVPLVSTEFKGDNIEMTVNAASGSATSLNIPWGNESVHRFVGKVEIGGIDRIFIGEGDKAHRLSFGLIEQIGYVYLRGKGKVIQGDGTEITFGD
jgi:hypothetical protein